jgi:hypothetical protein
MEAKNKAAIALDKKRSKSLNANTVENEDKSKTNKKM